MAKVEKVAKKKYDLSHVPPARFVHPRSMKNSDAQSDEKLHARRVSEFKAEVRSIVAAERAEIAADNNQ